jgi:hypothetical protein
MVKFRKIENLIKKVVAVICHDAGGAVIISTWLQKNNVKFIPVLKGPARKLFKQKFKNLKIFTLDHAINNCDWVLTGTSLFADLERKSILKAKSKKIFVCSFLDHWVNYKLRFTSNEGTILPDEIWVGDKEAKKIAKKLFNKKIIRQVNNPFWIDVKESYINSLSRKKKDDSKINILFASSGFKDRNKINPEIKLSGPEIAKKFLENIKDIFPNKKINSIIIRSHPREKKNRYIKLVSKKNNIFLDKNQDIYKTLFSSTHVVGCESMVMVIGSIIGLKTINIDIGVNRLKVIPKRYINQEMSLLD